MSVCQMLGLEYICPGRACQVNQSVDVGLSLWNYHSHYITTYITHFNLHVRKLNEG